MNIESKCFNAQLQITNNNNLARRGTNADDIKDNATKLQYSKRAIYVAITNAGTKVMFWSYASFVQVHRHSSVSDWKKIDVHPVDRTQNWSTEPAKYMMSLERHAVVVSVDSDCCY